MLNCKSITQNIKLKTDTFEMEVHFQDKFQEDLLSLSVGSCSVFNDLKVTSEFSTGFTGILVKITDYSIIFKLRKSIENNFICKGNNMTTLTILLNGQKYVLNIDISKGKYIGFSKKGENELYLLQSKIQFEYD